MNSFSRRSLFSLIFSLLSIGIVMAQTSCPELVAQSFSALGENCSATARNQACYGHEETEASFLSSVEDDFFTTAGSFVNTSDLETLHTHALDADEQYWGLATMKLQANIPNALPDDNLVFISIGDTEVENAVNPNEAFVPIDGVSVRVTEAAGANLRYGPGTDYRVIGALQLDETALADGISEDGQWLRVTYGERLGWLSITLIDDTNPDLHDLPVLTGDLQTPMQSFYLRTGTDEPECQEAPENILLVQSPKNIESYFSVNGADIHLGSTGALRVTMIDGQPYLEIIVFDGTFEVDGKQINEGYHSFLCLGEEQSLGLDGLSNDREVDCEATNPERINPDEFAEEWCVLEDIPSIVLDYSIEILCAGEIVASNSSSGSESEIPGVNCGEFSIQTSNIPATNFTLSWSPAAGADSYDVAIYDNTGYQTSLHTGITGTSISLNGGVGIASAGWIDVRAFLGGVYACYTRLNFNRSGDPNEGPGDNVVNNMTISAHCYYDNGYMRGTVSWQDLADGETISATIDATNGSYHWVASNSSSQHSSSMDLSVYTDNAYPTTIRVTTSDGSSYTTAC